MRIEDIIKRIKGRKLEGEEVPLGATIEATRNMKWGYWEIVREIVQNALDACGYAEIVRLEDGIMISDRGKGFNISAFLFGVSEKDPDCDRGQFGNGMSFAVTTVLLLGMNIYFHSVDLLYIPAYRKKRGRGIRGTEEELEYIVMEKYEAKETIEGTRVYIQGWPEDVPLFRERFLIRDGNDAYNPLFTVKVDRTAVCEREVVFHKQILEPKSKEYPNAVFVKDIYVGDSKALGEELLFSYNLVNVRLDVSRNIPHMWQVRWRVGELWGDAPKDLIKVLLKRLEETKGSRENVLEWRADYTITNTNAWKEALKEYYKLQETPEGVLKATVCKTTDELMLVKYYARDVPILDLPDTLASALVAVNIIYDPPKILARRKKEYAETYSDKELKSYERKILNFIRRVHLEFCDYMQDDVNISFDLLDAYLNVLGKRVTEGELLEHLDEFTDMFKQAMKKAKRIKLKVFKIKPGFESDYGFYHPGENYIAFRRDILIDLTKVFWTYSHELVHALGSYYEPVKDTPEGADFVQFQTLLLGALTKMIAEKHYKWLREFRVTE